MDLDKVHGSMEIQLLTSHALLFKLKLVCSLTHIIKTHTRSHIQTLTRIHTQAHKNLLSHTHTHTHTPSLTHNHIKNYSLDFIHIFKHTNTHARVWVPEVFCKSICVSYKNDLKIANHPPIKKGPIDQINKKQKYFFLIYNECNQT